MENKKSYGWIWIVLLILVVGAGYYVYERYLKSATTVIGVPRATSTPLQATTSRPATLPADAVAEFGDEVAAPVPTKPVVIPPKIITLVGNYVYSEDPLSKTVGKMCFEPNQATNGIAKQLCFDNQDEVFAVLGVQKGFSDGVKECTVSAPATIQIKNYKKLTGDVGGYDTATLIKVDSQGKQVLSACK